MNILHADVARTKTGRCDPSASNLPSATRFAVRRNAFTTFGAEQIGVTESECLGHASVQTVVLAQEGSVFKSIGRRIIDALDQVSAEYGVFGALLIVDSADAM